ncbi:GATA-type domain-containing protein [Aphelenchoides besseyi]|nr:GATA-type domain-containing protein [Aphelenchoides besseyi]KAI6211143.1 GATA-type domain-containing protein [Aphelenchoides besseyi]
MADDQLMAPSSYGGYMENNNVGQALAIDYSPPSNQPYGFVPTSDGMPNQYGFAYDQNQHFQAQYPHHDYHPIPPYEYQLESSLQTQWPFESDCQQSNNRDLDDLSVENFNEFFMTDWDTYPPVPTTTDGYLLNQTASNGYPSNGHKPKSTSSGRKNVINQPTKTIKKKVTQNCHQNSVCSNCRAVKTTLWRRNHKGEVECNACNLYYRKNGRSRPEKLQARGIMRRTRNPQQSTDSENFFVNPEHNMLSSPSNSRSFV